MDARNVYKVIVAKRCTKQIENSPQKIQEAVKSVLQEISISPRENPNAKKLQGHIDYYRYRIGQYRLIYRIEDERLIVVAVRFAPRGDVYKNL